MSTQRAGTIESEKKWFVHSGKLQEGPFSIEEVQRRRSMGEINDEHHVWCKGMEAWKKITEVEAFNPPAPPVFESGAVPPSADQLPPAHHGNTGSSVSIPAPAVEELSAIIEMKSGVGDDSTVNIDISSLRAAEREAEKAHKVADQARKAFEVKSAVDEGSSKGMWLGLLCLVAGLGITGFVFQEQIMGMFGMHMTGVVADEVTELQGITKMNVAEAGPRAGLAASNPESESPSFYVATTLPDGTTFDVVVHSVTGQQPDVVLPITVSKKMAKTQSLSAAGVAHLIKGDYVVHVVEGGVEPEASKALLQQVPVLGEVPPYVQAGRKVITTKQYYLGGKRE